MKDLVWKLKPPIYHMFSYLQNCFNEDENLEKLTTFNTASVAVSSTDFFVKIYFFNNKMERMECFMLDHKNSKLIIEVKFDLHDLVENENALSIIETSIKEEFERKNNDINFNTDFIKIKIGYIIDHYHNLHGKQVIKEYIENLSRNL